MELTLVDNDLVDLGRVTGERAKAVRKTTSNHFKKFLFHIQSSYASLDDIPEDTHKHFPRLAIPGANDHKFT